MFAFVCLKMFNVFYVSKCSISLKFSKSTSYSFLSKICIMSRQVCNCTTSSPNFETWRRFLPEGLQEGEPNEAERNAHCKTRRQTEPPNNLNQTARVRRKVTLLESGAETTLNLVKQRISCTYLSSMAVGTAVSFHSFP